MKKNIDENVVADFGEEWRRFDQSSLTSDDHKDMFESYFHIFPWGELTSRSIGADIGCGSGRWASVVAPRVGHLHLVDPSQPALNVAVKNLAHCRNMSYHCLSVDALPFQKDSLDFAYSLGVLHHVPDTGAAIIDIAHCLKPGSPFLLYVYYALDARPFWFLTLWKLASLIRKVISVWPNTMKNIAADGIALLIYWPLSRLAKILDRLNILPESWPLSYYRDRSFYVLRTDALDRFGTKLEQRFTKAQVERMLLAAGFENILFSDRQPFWTVIAYKEITR